MRFQEPWALLQVLENQPFGQREFWGLFARCRFPGLTGAAALMGEQSLQAAVALGLACQHRLLGVTAAATGTSDPSFWTVRVLGPVYQVWSPEGQYSSPAGMGEPSF
jgi:hypothetical protein